MPLSVPFAFGGYWAAGRLMDRVGRRAAISLYLVLGSAAAVVCYQSTNDAVISAAYIALVTLNGVWPILQTMTGTASTTL